MGMADGAPSETARPERTLRSRSLGQSSRPSGNRITPSHRSICHLLKQVGCLSPKRTARGATGQAAADATWMKRADVAFVVDSLNAPIGRHPRRRRNGTGEGNGAGQERANWRGRTHGGRPELLTRRDGARGRHEQGANSLPDRPGRSRQHRASADARTALSVLCSAASNHDGHRYSNAAGSAVPIRLRG